VWNVRADLTTPIHTFGFALNGVLFTTFADYVVEAIKANTLHIVEGWQALSLPVCVAVQEQHYVGIRAARRRSESTPLYYCIVKFSDGRDILAAQETGVFIQFYSLLLERRHDGLEAESLYEWFNRCEVSFVDKVWIEPDGTKHEGQIPGF
jgi:hypothetical protein